MVKGLGVLGSVGQIVQRKSRRWAPCLCAAAFMLVACLDALSAHAQQDKPSSADVIAAIQELMSNQTPVDEFLGKYRLLIVGGPGMDERKKNRLWKKQLKYISPVSKDARERRLLILNDGTRSGNPKVDALVGASLLRLVEQPGSNDKIVEMLMVDIRSHPEMRPALGGGWQSILVGLDGQVKKRWDKPVKRRELFGLIDAMPMRQAEIQREEGLE